MLRVLTACGALLLMSACAIDRHQIGEPQQGIPSPSWTVLDLDERRIATYANTGTGREFVGVSGRLLALIPDVLSFARSDGNEECGEVQLEDHVLFFHETETRISIGVVPRLVPDSSAQVREYVNNEGEPVVDIPLVEGAQELSMCYTEFTFNKNTEEWSEVPRP
ncbi:MAG: hypothetical protein V2I43_14430 [Parvularcula sp.]|jgi:hypothetical protein|nr:hypothetical protein [Parvularcula sp.]